MGCLRRDDYSPFCLPFFLVSSATQVDLLLNCENGRKADGHESRREPSGHSLLAGASAYVALTAHFAPSRRIRQAAPFVDHVVVPWQQRKVEEASAVSTELEPGHG